MSKKVKVTEVRDGDSFEAVDTLGVTEYRMKNYDAPDKTEYGYKKAGDALTNLIGGKSVTVEGDIKDDHGRTLVNVTAQDGTDVDIAMLEVLEEIQAEDWEKNHIY